MTIQKTLQALIFLAFVSCNKNETIIDGGGGVNVPSVASAENTVSYYVTARNLTFAHAVPLTFTRDSLSYALSVTGYSYGKASILIYADSLRYRSADLVFNTNQAFTFLMRGCCPDSITLTFSQFSGRISFALGGIASTLPDQVQAEIAYNMLTSHRP